MRRIFSCRVTAIVLATIFLLSSCAGTRDVISDVTSDIAETFENSEQATDNTNAEKDRNGLSEWFSKDMYYTVSYEDGDNGHVDGEQVQRVKYGDSSSSVIAVPDEGYVFVSWSDGIETPERSDANIRNNITVFPIFIGENTNYSVTYEIKLNGTVYDRQVMNAKASQPISYTVCNIPLAYKCGIWSDGREGASRTDTIINDEKVFTLELVPDVLEVPVINIITEDGGGITSKTEYKSCTVSLANTEKEYCFENVSARLRGRGNSSWTFAKKSFRLKFDKKRSMFGSDYKAKDWVFISNYGDKSLLRNAIAYDMSKQFPAIAFTSVHIFIDVYLDGQYAGIYLMCDQMEVGNGRVDIGKDFDPNPAKTGYFIELDSWAKNERRKDIDYVTISRDYDRCYAMNSPDTDDPAYDPNVHMAYMKQYLEECLKALSDCDWNRICELIDVNSFADTYIVQEMFSNKDCFWLSFFLYKKPEGKLYAGPVWDFDLSSGNVCDEYGKGVYDAGPAQDIQSVGGLWIATKNTWYRRLLRNDEFKEMVRNRLVEYRPAIMSVIANTVTDGTNPNSYYSMYGKAMERNFERWKILGKSMWPNTPCLAEIDTLNGQIDYLRIWLTERYTVVCEVYGVPVE